MRLSKKFSFKRIALVATLALAGLFGISASVIGNRTNKNEMLKVEAAVPDYIYFSFCTSWNGGNTKDNLKEVKVYYFGTADSGAPSPSWDSRPAIKNISGAVIYEDSYAHLNIAKIPNPYHYQQVIFSCNQNGRTDNEKQTSDLTIPQDGKNFFLITSNNYSGAFGVGGKQEGEWMTFDDTTQTLNQNRIDWTSSTLHHETDTLYFCPSYRWATDYGDNGRRIWPYLELTFSSINVGGENYTSIAMYPSGIAEPNPDWVGNGDHHKYLFYFDNIPITALTTATIRGSLNNGKRIALNTTQKEKWYKAGSGHQSNVFGTHDYNWATSWDTTVSGDYNSFYYTPNRSALTYLTGSFFLDNSIDWPHDSYVPEPTKSNALVNENSTYDSVTVHVTKGDMFKYYTYKSLGYQFKKPGEESETTNHASQWEFVDRRGPHGYWLDNVKIYNTSGVEDAYKNEYIYQDGDAFRFLKGGYVKFRRLKTKTYTYADIELWFLNTPETNSNYYLVGEGSFVDGTPTWDISTGVVMKNDANNRGFITNQLLKKGDLFRIKNTSGTTYAWDDNNGVFNSNFSAVARNDLMWTVDEEKYDNPTTTAGTYGSKIYGPASGCSIYISVTNSTWLTASAKYGVRSFATEKVYVGKLIEGNYDESGLVVKCTVPYESFGGGFQICRMNSSCSEGGEYSDNIWAYSSNCLDNESAMKTTFEYDNTKIYTLNSGYFNIRLDNSDKIHIASIEDFIPDDAVYFDLGTNGAVASAWRSKHIGVRFWNSSDTSQGTNVELFEVHGHSLGESRYLFEATIPVLGNGRVPNMVLFYADTDVISQEDFSWSYQTEDQGFIFGANVCQLTGSTSASKYTCTWPDYISDEDRAMIYANYFHAEITCSDAGATPPPIWSDSTEINVNGEYQHICKNAQSVIWLANANQNGNDLEKAMSKYEYIILKYGKTNYPDFITRSSREGSPLKTAGQRVSFSNFAINNDISFTTLIIIIASSISLLSITALSVLVIKKRKNKEQ